MIVPTLSSLVLYSPTQHFLISVNKSKRVVLNSMSKPVHVDRRNCGVIGAQTFLRHFFFVAKKWHEYKLCISPDSFSPFLQHRPYKFGFCYHSQSYAKGDKSIYRAAAE